MKNQSFRTFFDIEPLMENVQDAKSYLIKRYAEKTNTKASDIDDETKKNITNNPKFLEIKDLMDKNKMPGNTLPFLMFRIDQGATIDQMEEIIELLKDNKNNLNSLPMTIIEYAKIDRKNKGNKEENGDDHRPGWEILRDDLSNIERKRKLKNFIDRLTPRMKEYVTKKASTKQLEKLEEISSQLKLMPKSDEGREAWDSFFYPDLGVLNDFGKVKGRMGSYDDIQTYAEYKDPSKALDGIIFDAEQFIEKWGEDEDATIARIKDIGPQAGIIYAKDGFLIMSARTPDAQRLVCSETGWCIRTDTTFWSYSTGRVQINVINNNIPTSEENSLVGITTNKNGTVHVEYNRPNRRVSYPGGGSYTGKPASELLKRIGVPQEGIEAFEKKFPTEADIKIALELFFRDSGKLTPTDIITSLLKFNRGFLSGSMSEEHWERISSLVSEIVSEIKGLTSEDFLTVFLGGKRSDSIGGVYSEASWNIFDKLVGTNYTKTQIERLYDEMVIGYDTMEEIMIQIADGEHPYMKKEDIKAMEYALEYKDKSLAKCLDKIKKIEND